jgi:thiamine monophosphate synthase
VTKENPEPLVGLETLRGICQAIRKPVVAIGGIKLENARDVVDAGAASIAVIRDLLDSPNVASRVKNWIDVLTAG